MRKGHNTSMSTSLCKVRKDQLLNSDAILQALFPTLRRQVLAAALNQPIQWLYLSELARILETSPSSLQRELSSLVEAGVLERRKERTRTYFRAQERSPVFYGLLRIFKEVTPSAPTILSPTTEQRADANDGLERPAENQQKSHDNHDAFVVVERPVKRDRAGKVSRVLPKTSISSSSRFNSLLIAVLQESPRKSRELYAIIADRQKEDCPDIPCTHRKSDSSKSSPEWHHEVQRQLRRIAVNLVGIWHLKGAVPSIGRTSEPDPTTPQESAGKLE